MYVDKSDPRKTAKFAISIGSATLFKEVFSSSFLISKKLELSTFPYKGLWYEFDDHGDLKNFRRNKLNV